jgi:hypothetical protein
MRSIKMFGLAIVAVVAFSAVAVAGASAEEFIASKTGKLNGKATNTQEFQTGTGAKVKCTTATPSGEVTETKATKQAVSVTYGGCSVEGIGTASVSLAMYTFFIPLEVSVLEPITITASVLGVKCKIEVTDQSLVTGHSMSELEYENKSGKLLVKSKVTKIASEIKESNSTSLCGTAGEKKEGTYSGNVETELEGGTIEVK